ncbi:MAG: hypothetical protein IPM27_10685 [Nitrosomonadales bacterium]|nr:hypothetical protein [Nitrosomonadales bacterium]
MISGRYFSGMLIATMFVCIGQAAAATVTSTLRVTAITVHADEQARAVQLGEDEDESDFDPNKLPPTASGPGSLDDTSRKVSRRFERRIQLTPGYLFNIVLEGRSAKHWEYVRELGSVIVVRRRAGASLFDLSERLTIGISY